MCSNNQPAKCFTREKCLISDLLFISTIKGIACLTFIAVIYDYSAKIVSFSSRFTVGENFERYFLPPMLNYEKRTFT
jgi:hypothetical protein